MHTVRALGIACVAVFAAACGPADSTAEIRELLAGAGKAAEQRDTGYFRDLLGKSYRDARGNDRDEMLRFIRGYFLTHSHIEVVSRIDSVELEGRDAAHAVLHAGLLGHRAGESLLGGVQGDLYRVELELVAQDGAWQVIGANWRSQVGD